MQQRPTLSAEEIAALHGHEATLATARSVLSDLAEIGFDVSEHVALADQVDAMRKGLLERFSSTTYVPTPTSRRARR